MSQLDAIRQSLPWASKLNDAELLREVSTRVGMPMQEIAQAFGVRSGQDMGIMRSGLSSGVDQLQSLGYSALGGISDAVGFNTGRDWANRRAEMNQAEAELYGRPELERVEDQSLGSAGDFAGYQISKQVPMIAGILGAQLIPGAGQAAGALGLTRLGAVAPRIVGGGGLQPGANFAARRAALAQGETAGTALMAGTGLGYGALYGESVEGGDPSPYGAMLGAPIYGAAEALVPAAVRGALRAPAEFTGNLLTRTAKAGGLASFGEAGTELVQNELEMGMRNDLTPEEIASRRLNSAVIGGMVGGSFGTLGGIRGPRTVDEGEFDLTSPPQTQGSPNAQLDPLQSRIDQSLGINRERVGQGYAKQFTEAFDEPSGVFAADPETGIERELTMGELQQRQAGLLGGTQQTTGTVDPQVEQRWTELSDKLANKEGLSDAEIQELGQLTRTLRDQQQNVASEQQVGEVTAEGAPPAPPTPSLFSESDQFYANVVEMPIPQGKARRAVLETLYNDAVASGVPLESAALESYWNQIGSGNYYGKNQQDRLRVLLQNAVVANRKAQRESVDVSTESVAAGAAPGGSGQPSPVVDGSVGTGGPDPAVRDGLPGAAGDTGAAVGQTGAVADPRTQPAPTVDAIADNQLDETDLSDAEQDQLEIARMTGQGNLASVVEETAAGQRTDDPTAGDTEAVAAEIDKVLAVRFDASPEGQRQSTIARAYLTAMRSAPQGSKVKLQEAIGKQFGVKPVTVRAYGNTTKLVEAAKSLGYTDAQARNLFEIKDNTKARAGEAIETETKAPNVVGALQQQGVTTAEGENIGFGMDDSNTWKLANVKDGAGDVANADSEQLANTIQSQLQAIDDLEQSMMELESQGLPDAVDQVRSLIAAEQAKLEAALKTYEDFLTGKKTKAAKAQATVDAKIAKAEAKQGKKAAPKTEQLIEDDVFMAPTEQAAAAWNAVSDGNPNVPSWASLSDQDQQTFVEFGPDNWTRQDVIKFAQDAGGSDMKFGKAVKADNPYTAKELVADIKSFIRADTLGRKLIVVNSIEDLLRHPDSKVKAVGAAIAMQGAYGVATDGRAFLIADRIEKGEGRAKFMHEVGAHLGLENLLPEATYNKLTQRIVDWAKKDDGSIESELAVKAAERVQNAGTPEADQRAELLAYFIEESMLAGIDPTGVKTSGPLRQWFTNLMAAFKAALTKLGIKPESLTAQDVVNLAFGAAQIELSGVLDSPVQSKGTKFGGAGDRTNTPEFKRWFGDSKVVDAEGKPLVVYHGSTADIEVFDAGKSPSGNKGFYFTQSTALASAYAKVFQPEKGGSIYPVYLSIKNPLVIDGTRFSLSGIKGRVARLLDPKRYKAEQETQALRDSLSNKDGIFFTDKDVALLREAGYDGVVIKRSPSSAPEAMVAFDPTQVKSATGNRGTFDPTNPDIRFGTNMPKTPTQSTIQRNVAKLPKDMQQPVRNTINGVNDVVRKALDRVVFTSTLIERAVNSGIKSAQTFSRLLSERAAQARELEIEVEKISDMYAGIADVDKGDGPRSLNQFLFESTRQGKWGYGDKADPEMAEWFDKLKPSSQALAKAIFAHGDKVLAQKKQAVLDYTNSEFDSLIKEARADGDADLVKELQADKANSLKRFETLFKVREGIPYAPIKRMGNHVVVAKSAEYREAEDARDNATLRKLEKDPDHYHVSFTDTKNEARNLAENLREQGHFGGDADAVSHFERTPNDKNLFGNSSEIDGLVKLRSKVDEREGKGQAELQRMVTELWLASLAENSARKSEMRRRGVSGEVDMLRSFATQGRADAQFIASMQYNPQTQDALQAMRNEVSRGGGDRDRKSQIHNELLERYAISMDVVRNPAIDKLTRTSSVYFLASSPMYYLQNLTQPWMMSVPAMAANHDYDKVSSALWKAYGELGPIMKSAKLLQGLDFTKVPADVSAAIQELVKRGRIDIGLDTELGEFRIDGQGAFSDRWNQVDKALRLTVQKGEAVNRLSTAIAAYRLEMSKTKDHQKALDYTDKILLDTHGDYGRFNAPKYFNTSLGRVALQFRKFQLIQLTFYAKLLKDFFAKDAKQRMAARRTLGFALGHTALAAGVMGLPGYAAISWALSSVFGDDDEPFDVTLELRKLIGDEDMANLIMRGAPTLVGSDISGKVGAGTMLSVMPFSNADLTTPRGQAEAFGTLMGGASLGMGMRMADGLGLMMSGDWMKGSELLLPKGLGDAIKGYRVASEGMTRRNGDVILPAEDISAVEALMTAIGMAPVQTTVTYERRQRARDMDNRFQERATRLKNQYAKAAKKNDTAGMREAREAWMTLQDVRSRSGYTRQPLSNLLRAPQEQDKRERNTVGGVQTNRNNAGFARMQSEF
jgi:hypothetical protein